MSLLKIEREKFSLDEQEAGEEINYYSFVRNEFQPCKYILSSYGLFEIQQMHFLLKTDANCRYVLYIIVKSDFRSILGS